MVSRNPVDFHGIVIFFKLQLSNILQVSMGLHFLNISNAVFTHITLAIMLILASEGLQRENKKSSNKMLPPVRI